MSATPDIAGEIVGYRCWYVGRRWQLEHPRLVSLNDTIWPRRAWLVAECGRAASSRDECPHESHNGCGIHAARDRKHLIEMHYTLDSPDIVIGEVALAGKVIPGELGWRAEKARPVRLWVSHLSWGIARPLKAAYGVPVGVTNVEKAVDPWT